MVAAAMLPPGALTRPAREVYSHALCLPSQLSAGEAVLGLERAPKEAGANVGYNRVRWFGGGVPSSLRSKARRDVRDRSGCATHRHTIPSARAGIGKRHERT